jgi:hypothetical protein
MPKSEFPFRYRIRNWPEHNRALVKRGELTLWFDEDAIAGWRHRDPSDGPGRPKVYADAAIQCAMVPKLVFHLSLRSSQGFLRSLVELLALDLPVPDYTTVSRRQGALGVRPPMRPYGAASASRCGRDRAEVYGAGE